MISDVTVKQGSLIRRLRKRHGLTQEYMARQIGLSRPTYVKIENGERELRVDEADRIAGIFGIEVAELRLGEAPMPKVILEKEKPRKAGHLEIRVTSRNLEKFRNVLLYTLEKAGAKPNIGETVLHKLLYFIDFDYYEKYEENLIGATYIKTPDGPTPVEFKEIVADMLKREDIVQVKSNYFRHPQKKYLPLRHPDLSELAGREVEHIEGVLARHSDKNVREICAYSRGDIPWISADPGGVLSYESVFYRDETYSVRNYDDEL